MRVPVIALGLALDEELIVLSKVPHDENLAQLEIGLGLLEGLPLRLGCEVVDEQLLELLGEVLRRTRSQLASFPRTHSCQSAPTGALAPPARPVADPVGGATRL